MTLYEEMYYNMANLSKFYRFEGFSTYSYFSFQESEYLSNVLNYVYFSRTEKHHDYFVTRRLRQFIFQEILEDSKNCHLKKRLLDSGSFNEILKCIENYSFDDKLLSIEFSLSPIMKQLLFKNTISNRFKTTNDRRVEKVDYNTYGGGYGFCEEWLKVFNLLTYFYSYRRVTKDNILDFLYAMRRNVIEGRTIINPVSFLLEPRNKVIKVNNKIYSDFSKYELMDALQNIVDGGLYFENSLFAVDSNEKIRRIIRNYNFERECLLDLADSIYQRNLTKTLQK